MQSKITKDKILTQNSQELRRNMTKEEKHLWYDFLKKLPITVNRQKVFGKYIVDFYIHSARLVIELDGSQHETRTHKSRDNERDDYFASLGIAVLRYPNSSVNNAFPWVCQDILNHLGIDCKSLYVPQLEPSPGGRCHTNKVSMTDEGEFKGEGTTSSDVFKQAFIRHLPQGEG